MKTVMVCLKNTLFMAFIAGSCFLLGTVFAVLVTVLGNMLSTY